MPQGRARLLTALSFAAIVSAVILSGGPAQAQPVFPTQLLDLQDAPDSLAAADFDEDGRPDLAVGSSTGSEGFSFGGVILAFGGADGTFERRARLYSSTYYARVQTVTADDVDGDGHVDLLVGFDGEVRIFRGLGPQGFEAPTSFSAGSELRSILVGDVDLDGHRDLVVLTSYSTVSVYRGLGGAAFGPEIRTQSGFEGVHHGALVDFDHDGLLDLVGTGYADFVSYRGMGDGTFRFSGIHGSVYPDPRAIAVGDLDGDGQLDAVSAGGVSNTVTVALGIGSPSFVQTQTYPVGGTPTAVVFGDFNGDHRLDLATANASSNDISVLLNVGGTLQFEIRYAAGDLPVAALAADLDTDGRSDLVVANSYGHAVGVYLGTDSGRFDEARAMPVGDPNTVERSAAVVDLDADGHPDIISADRGGPGGAGLFFLRGHDDGSFDAPRVVAPVVSPTGLLVGRFDGDAFDDVVSLELASVRVRPGRGDGTLGPPIVTPLDSSASAAAAADFDADGRLDLAIGQPTSTTLRILRGRGDGGFDAGEVLTSDGGPLIPTVGDFNGDGRPDLAALNSGRDTVDIFLGRGDGTFVAGPRLVPGARTFGIHVGDLNDDGRDDVCVTTLASGIQSRAVLFPGRGDGTFDPRVEFPPFDFPGRGEGTFDHRVDFPPYEGAASGINHADVNGDGRTDLLINGYGLVVMFGAPAGGFRPAVRFQFGPAFKGLASRPLVADFNGDGRMDVAGTLRSYGIGVALNRGGVLDLDGDGIPNGLDGCTDQDGDGLGDARFPSTICPPDPCPLSALNDADQDGRCDDVDNCPVFNPGQEDGDGDGAGDACDICLEDADPDQSDRDGDLHGDACDTCPTVTDSDQADANHDGSGDACQPTFDFAGILEDGGENLEVRLLARDPQGEPLSGRIEVIQETPSPVLLLDALEANDCSLGFLPDGVEGEGVGFTFGVGGDAYLFDLASVLGCGGDAVPDFLIAPGTCDAPSGPFDVYLLLSGLPSPGQVCLRPFRAAAGGLDLTIEAYDPNALHASWINLVTVLTVPFASGLPRVTDISALEESRACRLRIAATDGNTVPIELDVPFFHHAEGLLVINHPPVAAAIAPAAAECAGPGGALVTLDGTSSADVDSTAGTADDITEYDWFDESAPAGGTLLGHGPSLTALLPVGDHPVLLWITDRFGETADATVVVTVRDTVPPDLAIAPSPASLWPPNHRLVPVHVTWQARDLCDPNPAVTLVAASSDEPDDSPGTGDGTTTGDIAGADIGSGDADILLRAERLAEGGGRIYDLAYRTIDASGNATLRRLSVTVPQDQGQGPDPLSLRLEPFGPDARAQISWPAVAGASAYDVIAGDLGGIRAEAGTLRLGAVRVLARGTTSTTLTEEAGAIAPSPGAALFYLVQFRGPEGPSGFGTASAPLPRSPTYCDGGCP